MTHIKRIQAVLTEDTCSI